MTTSLRLSAALALALAATAARADITVGVVVSATGPAASIGIPEKNAIALGPSEIAGEKVRYIVLDDGSDTTTAVRNARKLSSEHQADIVLGSTTVPTSMAMIDVMAETGTPMVTFAPALALTSPVDDKRRWVFKTMTGDDHELIPLLAHMKATGKQRVAYIGFADSFGEGWLKTAEPMLAEQSFTLLARERYARTDTSVIGQVMKIIATRPDAVMIGASSGPAALPVMELRNRGYRGDIYLALGATFGDFVRIAGSKAEGVYAPISPAAVQADFPPTLANRDAVLAFVEAYEKAYGAGSRNMFAGSAWDAVQLLQQAAPQALQQAKPGSAQFRAALRAQIETISGFAGARGVYHFSPSDHAGLDRSALMLGRLEGGQWRPVQ